MKDYRYIAALALRYGPEVYKVLDIPVSTDILPQFEGIPSDLLKMLNTMFSQIQALEIADVAHLSSLESVRVVSLVTTLANDYQVCRFTVPVHEEEVDSFNKWIQRKYLVWRHENAGIGNPAAVFAKLIGVSRQTFQYMIGKPTYGPLRPETIKNLASVFGNEVYSVPGILPPDFDENKSFNVPAAAYSVMIVDPAEADDDKMFAFKFKGDPMSSIKRFLSRCEMMGVFGSGEGYPWINLLSASGHVLKCYEIQPGTVADLLDDLESNARPLAV